MIKAVDILLYIALGEEFDSVMETLGESFKPRELEDVAITVFFGKIYSPYLGKNLDVAATAAGKMGNTRSASLTSSLIEKLKPACVVVLGIAGSLSNDLEPGDVFVPDSVNEYLANSASVGEGENWTFATSGNDLQTSVRLLDRLQNFSRTAKVQYAHWQDDARKHRIALISQTTVDALTAEGLLTRGVCKLYVGDDRKLASGPAVGKGRAFLDWLKREVDRKIAAMEMESAGVYDAVFVRTPAPRVVAIRGISDYADSRKEKLESIAKNGFRELSINNAISLFVRSAEAGLFGPDSGSKAELAESAVSTALDSHLKSVLVIGGQSGETADVDAELPRLNQAALALGRVLALAGAQLIVCSPFPDVVDYYVAMGYADAKQGGVIQFHSPTHPRVEEKRRLLRKTLGQADLKIQDFDYPGPEDDDSWVQAWSLAQIQALDRADLVIALGGKVSQSANTLLHLAEAKGVPIIPFAFLGGAARRAYERRDWKRLNPGLDASLIANVEGIEQTVRIANQLLVDRVRGSAIGATRPQEVFISVARQDGAIAQVLKQTLIEQGIEVSTGESEIRADQLIPVSIEQAILRSDVLAVFWSRHYALSPWCFDELDLALKQQAYGRQRIWLFNLDDSAIVPTRARQLPSISVRNSDALKWVVSGLLSGERLP